MELKTNVLRILDKNKTKYLLNKSDYLLSFENLCEITVDNKTEYLGSRIREKPIEDNYNLKVNAKKKGQ